MCIVGIAELIEQLLLHVIAHHAFVGDGSPEVFVAVDIDDTWYGFDTHACKDLLHVALKALCLWMIDAIAGCCLYQ